MAYHRINRRDVMAGAGAALSLVAAGAAAQGRGGPVASTLQGRARGFRRNGADIFLGLPYGASTAGARRFLPPVPPAAWRGERDATRLGQRAPQLGDPIYKSRLYGEYLSGGRAQELIALNEPMGEDCLVLNVLTPAADRKRRPVMVYIHGGGFATGSGAVHTLGDRFVAEEDVVLVTVNHRLNNLGFLYLAGLSPRYAEANPGMLDLVAALRWVRDNIAGFGGDPTKVTVFGESGGGAKIALLLAMPDAAGLFRAAIMESTGIPGPMQTPAAATEQARTLLATLGIDPAGELAALQALPVERFIPAPGGGPGAGGATPIADGRIVTQAWPWTGAAPAIAARVPLIVGYCKDETTLFTGMPDQALFTLPDWGSARARLAAFSRKGEAAVEPALAAYRAVYPQDTPSRIFFRMSTAAIILGRGAHMTATAKAAQAAPVYFYRMQFDTGIPPGLGAFHTSELPLATRMVATPRAEGLSRQIAGAWAAFARTGGDPNHAGMPRWGRFRADGGDQIMVWDTVSRAGPDPEREAQRLWLDLIGPEPLPVFTRASLKA